MHARPRSSDEQGPFGRNLEPTARIRHAVRVAGFETPIVVAGGIHGFDQAEAILQQDRADIVAAARQSLADPDWFLKMRPRQGRGGPPLRLLQLLRGPRPEAQAGDLSAVGSGGVGGAGHHAVEGWSAAVGGAWLGYLASRAGDRRESAPPRRAGPEEGSYQAWRPRALDKGCPDKGCPREQVPGE